MGFVLHDAHGNITAVIRCTASQADTVRASLAGVNHIEMHLAQLAELPANLDGKKVSGGTLVNA